MMSLKAGAMQAGVDLGASGEVNAPATGLVLSHCHPTPVATANAPLLVPGYISTMQCVFSSMQ